MTDRKRGSKTNKQEPTKRKKQKIRTDVVRPVTRPSDPSNKDEDKDKGNPKR